MTPILGSTGLSTGPRVAAITLSHVPVMSSTTPSRNAPTGSVPAALVTLAFIRLHGPGEDLDRLVKLVLAAAIVLTAGIVYGLSLLAGHEGGLIARLKPRHHLPSGHG